MPATEKPGAYVTWVPMYGYNHLTELDEPYMPYFGDEDLTKAQEIYEAMCKDFGARSAFDLASDGEDVVTDSTPRKKTRNRGLPNDLRNLRLREAQRHAILTTVNRYGQHEYVWNALAHALRIRNTSRVQGMHVIAAMRRAEAQKKRKEREERDEHTKLVMDALEVPEPVMAYPPRFVRGSRVPLNEDHGHYEAASRHFCFVCWVFGCKVHNPKETVEPIEPIADWNTDNRIEQLKDGVAKPCSRKCHLLEDCLQLPTEEHENNEWTAEEEWLLREAVPIFRNDPCSLAVAIGSRPCRAVKKKLEPHEYQRWIDETVRLERRGRTHTIDPFYKEQLKKAQRKLAAEKKQERKNNRKNLKKKSVRARKSCNSYTEPTVNVEHARFVPCNHPGPCVEGEKNCICVLKNTHCQSRCGCNGARLIENESGEIEWKGKDCGRGATGCSCKDGNCLDAKCVCAGDLVACNPDICTCDCRNLKWDPQTRKCRNVDAIYPRHKRTYVGKSKYNLGLFAGERFKKGDLVGVYFGNVIGEELIEQAIRVGQEMNSTYAMDLTDDLSIDALRMGSKVRYVNHASSINEGVNCECKFVSIRGDPRAILRTTRTVEAGQEFYFDYKLTHTEGNDWLWKGKKG